MTDDGGSRGVDNKWLMKGLQLTVCIPQLVLKYNLLNQQGRTSRIRIVKKAGRSIKNVLAPNYPWSIELCKDPEGFPCSTADGPPQISCRTPGVIYNIVCWLCEYTGNSSVY